MSGRDLTGEIFGVLTVIGRSDRKRGKSAWWDNECSLCASVTTTTYSNLVRGGPRKSCNRCKFQHAIIHCVDVPCSVCGATMNRPLNVVNRVEGATNYNLTCSRACRTKLRDANSRARRYASPRLYFSRTLGAIRRRANRRGMDYDLTVDYLVEIFESQKRCCKRTGLPMSIESPLIDRVPGSFIPSVDRVDNTKGYTMDNVEIVCNAYNVAKSNMNSAEFFNICRAVVEHQGFICTPKEGSSP